MVKSVGLKHFDYGLLFVSFSTLFMLSLMSASKCLEAIEPTIKVGRSESIVFYDDFFTCVGHIKQNDKDGEAVSLKAIPTIIEKTPYHTITGLKLNKKTNILEITGDTTVQVHSFFSGRPSSTCSTSQINIPEIYMGIHVAEKLEKLTGVTLQVIG